MDRFVIGLSCTVLVAALLAVTLSSPRKPGTLIVSTDSPMPSPAVEVKEDLDPPLPRELEQEVERTRPRDDREDFLGNPDGGSTAIFDGATMQGWTGSDCWTVENGAMYCPTSEQIEALTWQGEIIGPFEFSVELEMIGRSKEDGRGFWVKNGQDEFSVRIDNVPDEFQLQVLPGKHEEQWKVPLQEGVWYSLKCRVDESGTIRAWLDGAYALSASWDGRFPLTLGFTCERSGGRFRNARLVNL